MSRAYLFQVHIPVRRHISTLAAPRYVPSCHFNPTKLATRFSLMVDRKQPALLPLIKLPEAKKRLAASVQGSRDPETDCSSLCSTDRISTSRSHPKPKHHRSS